MCRITVDAILLRRGGRGGGRGREVKKRKQTRAIFFAPYVYLNWISVTVNTDAHMWTKVRHDIMYTIGTHNDTKDRHVWCSKLSVYTTTRNCSHAHVHNVHNTLALLCMDMYTLCITATVGTAQPTLYVWICNFYQ